MSITKTHLYILLIVAFIIILGVSLLITLVVVPAISKAINKNSQANDYVDTSQFEFLKKRISTQCNEIEFDKFYDFLTSYKGGFIRRNRGKIIHQEYKNSEKGDLKGIFYHVIVQSSSISIARKEKLRHYMIQIGVDGVMDRPDYESREGKLSTKGIGGKEFEGDELARKQSGNLGESIIRGKLKNLPEADFKVLNGIVLSKNGITHEFDHIVIGKTGVFALETKAFGLSAELASDEHGSAGTLIVGGSHGEGWVLKRGSKERSVPNPTEQILTDKNFLEDILIDFMIEVHPVLVLANSEITINIKIDPNYPILKANAITTFIKQYHDSLTDGDRMMALQMITEYRKN